MIKAIFKTICWAIGIAIIPILLIIIGIALSIVGPIAGLLMIIFLPLIIAGIAIGYSEAKKHKD